MSTSTGPPIQYTTYTPTASTDTSTIQPQTSHYPNHYPNVPITVPLTGPIPGQPTAPFYSPYPTTAVPGTTPGVPGDYSLQQQQQQQQLRQINPAPARPPSPSEPAITPVVAQRALRKLIENECMDVGFDSADVQSVRRLEVELVAFIQQLFERAHEFANLANRAGTIPSDLLLALNDFGIEPKELYPLARKRRAHRTEVSSNNGTNQPTPTANAHTSTTPATPSVNHSPRKRLKRKPRASPMKLTFSASRSPSPDLLPSDDEPGPPIIPTTLRGLPPYLPQLPPKHTYLQTPASPPKKAALPSLEKKLKTASLVQESLKNLLLATEDSTGQEDAELLGHIVNWETGLHPRKRWKVGGR